ncbi:glycosyltransferase [Labrys sp. LIt4]|uniref:CgeB family protein n=1 Tax=Labrys sp. LIt4 TaxID=2821355 RepID=UPI001ADEE2CF|nr:glycosyltransferase [Labrys sp. LIt4]MBP0582550.1 glycosyltransferase [Labrys sp. LIt4]
MRFVFYTHSLVSDWNHGNAHFLRGVMRELVSRGHDAVALEPADGWSRANLIAEAGQQAVANFAADFPNLQSVSYDAAFDHEALLASADIVIVHEWTDPELVRRIGMARRRSTGFILLFHDTHHRAVSEAATISSLALEDYDAVLAFGETLRERYLRNGWGRQVHIWHEAADVSLFHSHPELERDTDLVWIGNWGDGERSAEIADYLVEPVRRLGLSANVHGVRYPPTALAVLANAGIRFRGWIPNAQVPKAFARHRATVHIPRRPYVESLPGIPTIRMFEALACGIPLISAPWEDTEDLFRPGVDFLFASNGAAMEKMLRDVLHDTELARSLAAHGLETIKTRHTCAHRVDELLAILRPYQRRIRDQQPAMESVQ